MPLYPPIAPVVNTITQTSTSTVGRMGRVSIQAISVVASDQGIKIIPLLKIKWVVQRHIANQLLLVPDMLDR